MKFGSILTMVALASIFGAYSPAAFAQRADDTTGNGIPRPELPTDVAGRYRITYFKSNTATSTLRTATVVSITNNQWVKTCTVSVDWKISFGGVVCTTTMRLQPGQTANFCSRPIPDGITTCVVSCSPALTFNQGNAIVGSTRSTLVPGCENIAVSARTIYTSDAGDSKVDAITDAKVVKIGAPSSGD